MKLSKLGLEVAMTEPPRLEEEEPPMTCDEIVAWQRRLFREHDPEAYQAYLASRTTHSTHSTHSTNPRTP